MPGLFRRGDLPEPPPAGWEKLGVHPDYQVREIEDAIELDRLCRAAGVSMGDYGRGRFAACVDRPGKQVLIPSRADAERRAALLAHEGGGHTWGLTHGGRHKGWVTSSGAPATALSDAQVQMMRSMAEAERRRRLPTTAPAQDIPRGLIGSSARQIGAQ